MSNLGKSLSKDVIKNWPEVFSEVKLNVLPLRYLYAVLVNFKDGKTWEIRITTEIKRNGWPAFEKNLAELVIGYEDNVDNVDFKLDTIKVRRDVERSTQKFLKKKKL